MKIGNSIIVLLMVFLVGCSKNQTNNICIENAVIIDDSYGSVFLPNAFTPNLDGVNDLYKIGHSLKDSFAIDSIQIFDSNNSMVLNVPSPTYNWGWDGINGGELVYGEFLCKVFISDQINFEELEIVFHSVKCLLDSEEYPNLDNCRLPDYFDDWLLNREQIENLKCRD